MTIIEPKPASGSSQEKSADNQQPFRAKVRMYRQGLGDCFLITIPSNAGKPFHVVIDCGVILGTKQPEKVMKQVVQHIIDTTESHINLLVATHEHWDHISGFNQAKELWKSKELKIDEVWLSWAEDPKNDLSKKLKDEHLNLKLTLQAATTRISMSGNQNLAEEISSLMSFFGAAGSTSDALQVVRELSKKLRYCTPKDAPTTLSGTNVKVYVLGPPLDERFIKKFNPSKRKPETYGLNAMSQYTDSLGPALEGSDIDTPFDDRFQIPSVAAKQLPFFQQFYWGDSPDPTEPDQSWRRIDDSWLDSSSAMALQLDSATNNTCLVLAFELADGDVLLFAADAQVGNWLSWQDLSWDIEGKEGKKVTGPDLLNRTIFYKVGHHGSHNATLREKGLEEMKNLKLAFVPVDHEMAVKKRWNKMPLNELMDRLNTITNDCVVRIDEEVPAKLEKTVSSEKLFHEVTF
ncbi:MAG TPA: MBL fold metallo-hydrolase [Pyrinomonadaceae bacterium]|nr:MBL fold metallo-hydrolase [Pyrinomonadaceae bacterium]